MTHNLSHMTRNLWPSHTWHTTSAPNFLLILIKLMNHSQSSTAHKSLPHNLISKNFKKVIVRLQSHVSELLTPARDRHSFVRCCVCQLRTKCTCTDFASGPALSVVVCHVRAATISKDKTKGVLDITQLYVVWTEETCHDKKTSTEAALSQPILPLMDFWRLLKFL
jgi:hypothetical protein